LALLLAHVRTQAWLNHQKSSATVYHSTAYCLSSALEQVKWQHRAFHIKIHRMLSQLQDAVSASCLLECSSTRNSQSDGTNVGVNSPDGYTTDSSSVMTHPFSPQKNTAWIEFKSG
jgi:hypothetical protein